MQYQSVTAGTFLERPNRFIAMVDLDGRTERVHVKNTGRCRELLVPGYKVYLAHGTNPNRKTRYDLIAVEKGAPRKDSPAHQSGLPDSKRCCGGMAAQGYAFLRKCHN